jgi:hypothetical protein
VIIKSQLMRAFVVIALIAASACAGRTPERQPAQDEGFGDFQQRIDAYMELHNRLKKQGPAMTTTKEPADTQASEQALASRIRADRATAKQGDIFTPAIATRLRALMNPELRGGGASNTRASIREDAPKKFSLTVNGPYPLGEALPTMPANLLQVLPRLPEELEFRIVDRHLILRDVQANIVVDYLFDVMCANC